MISFLEAFKIFIYPNLHKMKAVEIFKQVDA